MTDIEIQLAVKKLVEIYLVTKHNNRSDVNTYQIYLDFANAIHDEPDEGIRMNLVKSISIAFIEETRKWCGEDLD